MSDHIPEITVSQAVAYRLAAHGLTRRVDNIDDLELLHIGVQDTPGGAARIALANRLKSEPDPAADHRLVWSLRGAPHYHRPDDLAVLGAQLYPVSDNDAFKRLFDVSPALRREGWGGLEAFAAAVEAMRTAVVAPTAKGDASALVTAALSEAFSVDCVRCGARHVREQTFRLAALPAGLELEPGTSPPVLRPMRAGPQATRAARVEDLMLAYLRLNGPAGPAELAWFLQTSTAVGRELMPPDLAEVSVDGSPAWIPKDRLEALVSAEGSRFIRLVAHSDALLRVGDKELLVANGEHRAVLYKPVGSPGALIVDGRVGGTWRARAKGKELQVHVEPFPGFEASLQDELHQEAHRVAEARGMDRSTVTVSS